MCSETGTASTPYRIAGSATLFHRVDKARTLSILSPLVHRMTSLYKPAREIIVSPLYDVVLGGLTRTDEYIDTCMMKNVLLCPTLDICWPSSDRKNEKNTI